MSESQAQKKRNKFTQQNIDIICELWKKDILRSILKKDNLKLQQRHPEKDNNYSLRICGGKQCYEISKWMYNGSTIHLQRKYEKYQELCRKYEK